MIMASPASGSQTTTEYVVRVPRNSPKQFNIMAFNSGDQIDFSTWTHAKMEHDLSNKKIYQDEEKPEFGAGSEFRKKQREEARRKKFGFASREFRVEDQPWSLRINGKAGRRFKGTKKGGVTENASYFIFTKCADGAFEAFPLNSWYNFTRQVKHKTLSAEEAEAEWGRRNTVLNRFTIMLQKRLKDKDGDLDETEDGEVGKKVKKQNTKKAVNLKIHDMEEDLEMSSDSEAESNSEGEGGSKNSKEKSAGKGKTKKNKKKGLESEALEESDDGDFEGAEVDYMSNDTSEEEPEDKGTVKPDPGKEIPKGVDEEMGSSEESEDENENDKEDDDGKKTPVSEKKEKKKKVQNVTLYGGELVQSYRLLGLEPDVEYVVRILAFTEAGDGPQSNLKKAITSLNTGMNVVILVSVISGTLLLVLTCTIMLVVSRQPAICVVLYSQQVPDPKNYSWAKDMDFTKPDTLHEALKVVSMLPEPWLLQLELQEVSQITEHKLDESEKDASAWRVFLNASDPSGMEEAGKLDISSYWSTSPA